MISNPTRDCLIASAAQKTRHFWERARGLLLSSPLQEGEGLILPATNWIHTWGMAYSIDVLYLDREGRIVAISEKVPPWRIGPWVRAAQVVVELPPGTIARSHTQVGDRLIIEAVQGLSYE